MSAVEVKGTQEMMNQAQKGLELMKSLEAKEVQGDEGKAAAFKAEMDLRIASLKQQAEELTGKDNKKARAEKSKEAAALGNEKQYIDAVRVLKGLSPMHGFFVKEGQENLATAPVKSPVVASLPEADVIVPDSDLKGAKKAAKPKKEESAGLSKGERDELEKVKNDIIALKAELKDGGMSGGQINKDERVVSMVARMNELKEKECPGSTTAKAPGKADDKKKKVLSAEAEAEVAKLTKEIEEYRTMLQTEYKYSKKEIAADPDMIDKTAALAKLTGKK